ncbi:MAG: hypothetical protein RLZZ221_2400 [Verrucomicrobiota bacterium]
MAGQELQGPRGAGGVGPRDRLPPELEEGVLRHVADRRIPPVAGPAAGLRLGAFAELREGLAEGVVDDREVATEAEVLAEIVAWENDGAAGVFLLAAAEQVGGEADLGLHLLFAVAEVIVGNEGQDHAAPVARGDLEGHAVVVRFRRVLPAHAVAPLAGGRLRPRGQAEFALGESVEVRGEDHAAGVSRPVGRIEGGVVGGEVRVAGVAEDALDEVEVGHERPRDEEARLHRVAAAASRSTPPASARSR